jgi:hypothetical protein
MALTAFEVSLAFRTPLDECGVPGAGAFEKKLAIDRCPDCDPALEVCFFTGGGLAGVAFTASFGFPMLISRPRWIGKRYLKVRRRKQSTEQNRNIEK